MGSRPLNLLLITAGCGSTAVGEAWSSFQWISRMAQCHNVTVLTCRHSQSPSSVPELPGARVIEWTEFALFEKWARFNAMLKPGYVGLYLRARRWLRDRLQSGEKFDLVHQISPLALRYPSPAAGLGVPLVIGPLGGSLENPKEFDAELHGGAWYTKLRFMDKWRLQYDPLLRHSYSRADCIVCVAPYVRELLGDLPSHEVEFMSETGVVQLPPPRGLATKGTGKFRLLFVGRVIRSKGLRDAIRAIAKLKDINGLALDVVGDGEDLDACRKEAHEFGVGDRVIFHGRRPRSEVDEFYARADAFVFPSFREPSGNVVIEAMSHGLAMIVADRGGPGFVVDDACGFRVPVVDPEQFASAIAACIRRLVQEPNLIAAMGAAAREKVIRTFLWDVKVETMSEIYERVLAKRAASKLTTRTAPLSTMPALNLDTQVHVRSDDRN